jgi:hypothetical protein
MATCWFVNSRGLMTDYTWQPIGSCPRELASETAQRGWQGMRLSMLINEERPGLLLFESQSYGVVLLVTGLIPSSHPTDYIRRPIRASLLGVASAAEDPEVRDLVSIAAFALRENLAASLPVSYGTGTLQQSFEIDAEAWSKAVARAIADLNAQAAADTLSFGTGTFTGSLLLPDTESYRLDVAGQLAGLLHPETRQALAGRVFVLRTNILAPAEIAEIRPWRALSDVAEQAHELQEVLLPRKSGRQSIQRFRTFLRHPTARPRQP